MHLIQRIAVTVLLCEFTLLLLPCTCIVLCVREVFGSMNFCIHVILTGKAPIVVPKSVKDAIERGLIS